MLNNFLIFSVSTEKHSASDAETTAASLTDLCPSTTYCSNNGTCRLIDGIPKCICQSDFFGDHCETKLTCSELQCVHGVCISQEGKESCYCTPGRMYCIYLDNFFQNSMHKWAFFIDLKRKCFQGPYGSSITGYHSQILRQWELYVGSCNNFLVLWLSVGPRCFSTWN